MADDAISSALDYLGREQPIGQKSISGLPTSSLSAGGGGVAAPVTGPGAGPGGTPGAGPLAQISQSPVLVPESQSALSLAAGALGGGQQAMNWLNTFFGGESGGLAGLSPAQYGLAATAEHGATDVIPGTGGAAGGLFGAGADPSFGALGAALGTAGPIWAGLTALVDLIGEGRLPFQGLVEQIFGLNQPSKEWLNFGGDVRNTMGGIEQANQQFAGSLLGSDPSQALDAWRSAIQAIVPGWGQTPGQDIPDLPGATGKPHEWKSEYDFAPEVLGLRAEYDAARAGQSPEQRTQAFKDAAQTWQAQQDAARMAREATDAQAQQQYLVGNTPGSA